MSEETTNPYEMPDYPVYDFPSQHAFVMTGTENLFLCHLTMLWMEVHMYELILKAKIPNAAMAAYVEDSRKHPDETYFIGNEIGDAMTVPDVASCARKSFIASVWRGIPDRPVTDGWPWKNATPPATVICENIPVTVERIVHFRHFDFNRNYPDTLTYVMFGAGTETHLFHQQTQIPDFDSVVSLKKRPEWIAPRLLAAGVPVNFPAIPDRKNGGVHCFSPLEDGSTHRVQYAGPRIDQAADSPANVGYPIKIGRTLWFNTKVTNGVGVPDASSTPRPDPCHGKGGGEGG